MKRITLMCAGGMSSSLLEVKVRKEIEKLGVDCSVVAVSVYKFEQYIDKTDVFLIAPQVRYELGHLKPRCDERGIPIDNMNFRDYGTMDGEAILRQALKLLGEE